MSTNYGFTPPSSFPDSHVTGRAMPGGPMTPGQNASDPTKYGIVVAKAGAPLLFTLPMDQHPWKKGEKIYLTVQELSRQPESVRDSVEWFCGHARCFGKTSASFEELQAAHPATKDMWKQKEVHLCCAMKVIPEVKAVPASSDGKGAITRAAVDAKPASVSLFSPEE